jgi:NAD(P)-dependent dehydrogenase (short-subunit alcohol dehydrogenase family)
MTISQMFHPELLAGRVALVTGGGTGLGRAIAEAIVQHGGKVALVARRADVLDAAAEAIGRDKALPVRCDVRFRDEVDAAIEVVTAHFGKIDVLINGAAGNFVYPTERLGVNAFKLIIDTVLMGTIHFSLALGRQWIKAKQPGTILSITTNYASTGSAYVVPSACAKAGVDTLIRSLAAEWGRYNIRVVGIAPGPFPTDGAMRQLRINEDLLPGVDLGSFITDRIPLGRMGRVEELANLAIYLLSPGADFITGEIVRIDGGEVPNLAGEFCFMHTVGQDRWDGEARRLKRNAWPAGPDLVPKTDNGVK